MSRTDKTKPWRVRVAEHQPWAEHDHRDGVCNLPDSPLDDNNWLDCHWSQWNLAGFRNCCQGCACRTCSGYYERKQERRRARHESQRGLREALKYFN